MVNKIQFRRGLKSALPDLDSGEPGYCTDTKELFIGNSTGANTKVVMADELCFNVQDYGAKGDGVTDDTSTIQATVTAALAVGGTVYFPSGRYVVSSSISINLTSVTKVSGTGISVQGSGTNHTVILNKSNTDYAFNAFSTDINTAVNFFRVFDMTITNLNNSTGHGIKLSGLCNVRIDDVLIHLLQTGIHAEDIVSSQFYSCRINECRYGLTAPGQINLTTPNDIVFNGCTFYGNAVYGAYFNEGCNVSFFGGSVETNGHDTITSEQRFGVKLDGFGRYGAGGAVFDGVYLEGNRNIADVWINHKDYPATYTFTGCTFNRFADPVNSQHNIRLDASNTNATTSAKVVVIGCGFRAFSGYVPDAGRRVIQFYGASISVLEQSGNYYNNQVDLPGPDTNRIFAHGRFVGLSGTPSLFRGFNVASIVKTATGDYTITFQFPSVINEKIATVGMSEIGFTRVVDATTTTIRIQCFAVNGTTAIDPTTLYFIACE